MAYLICEKCGGYYELGENESPDDFESCSCGGNLKYVQNLNSEADSESKSFNDINIKVCPLCRGKNARTSQICAICGEKLDEYENYKETTNKTVPTNHIFQLINEKLMVKKYSALIDFKAIISGCIVFIFVFLIDSFFSVESFFASGTTLVFLESLIGGFAAACVARPDYKSGILNGGLASLIFITGLLIIMMFLKGITDILLYIFYSIGNTVIPMIILAVIGAFVGTYLKRLIINAKQDNKTDFLVCNQCDCYYELPIGESPENFIDKCECGGNLKYISNLNANELVQNNYESKFVFHPVISIFLGFIVLFIMFSSSTIAFRTNPGLEDFMTITSFVFGGFIATYYTTEKKVQYGIYVGILAIIVTILLLIFHGKSLGSIAFNSILILLNVIIGSSIAKRVDSILTRKRTANN